VIATARTLRWILGLQLALAALLMANDLLRLSPGLLAPATRAPSLEMPVRPGDQTRRFPRRLTNDPAAAPGFPSGEPVPTRLTWTEAEIDGRPALTLTGAIDAGAARRFLAFLDTRAAPPEVVVLHSPGGSVSDALAIGRRLRADGVETLIGPGTACLSACPYLLIAGAERTVSRDAMVGVHQHYFGENTYVPAFMAVSDIQRGQAEVLRYLAEMGIDPMLAAKAMETPPDDIYVLVPDELESFRVATRLTD
jgi:hypothetical protein